MTQKHGLGPKGTAKGRPIFKKNAVSEILSLNQVNIGGEVGRLSGPDPV